MWTVLVSVEELAPRIGRPDLVLLDCRHKLTDPAWGPAMFGEGHLAGAAHAHIDHDLSSKPTPQTGRHPLPSIEQFRAACSRWGIGPSTQVVVYDDAGGVWAARAWWLLKDYGHEAVALLDGGIVAWRAAGLPTTKDTNRRPPTNFGSAPGHMPVVDAATLLGDARPRRILDARAPERYRGEVEPIDPVAGHIPGARNLAAVSLSGPDGRILPPDQLRAKFDAARGPGTSETVAYCGSGVTGSLLVLAAEAAGLERMRLYPGSWSEWIRDPNRPVERGDARDPATKPKAR